MLKDYFRHFLNIEAFGYIEELANAEILTALEERRNISPEASDKKNFIVIPPKISDRHGFLRYTISDYARNLNYHPRRGKRAANEQNMTISDVSKRSADEGLFDEKTRRAMADKQAANLEEIILNLYETFVFINEGTDSHPEYLEEAEYILGRIQEAHQHYIRKRRDSQDNDEQGSVIYKDMASTIEKLLMQTTHTRSEVLEYQNELINQLKKEKTEEIIYKDQRFNEINKNFRKSFKDMTSTIENQIIRPLCPDFKSELQAILYMLIASVTLNLILIVTGISRWCKPRADKGSNAATTNSSLL